MPNDWKHLTTAILEAGPRLQWQTCQKEEAKTIKQQNRTRGINIPQDQFLGEGQYAELQRQLEFDDHILALSDLAALNVWDKAEESGKRQSHILHLYKAKKQPSLVLCKD